MGQGQAGRPAAFYEVTDAEPDLEALQAALLDWEAVYNTVRPHQALGYLTPAEFLASLPADGRAVQAIRLRGSESIALEKPPEDQNPCRSMSL